MNKGELGCKKRGRIGRSGSGFTEGNRFKNGWCQKLQGQKTDSRGPEVVFQRKNASKTAGLKKFGVKKLTPHVPLFSLFGR
ncbi:MAG: hypothetical protein Q7T55_12795, partial [Solirubrobacteraceae bacterium]|nr:hypothetical protein [Solirubrobacteraceae bacterium]